MVNLRQKPTFSIGTKRLINLGRTGPELYEAVERIRMIRDLGYTKAREHAISVAQREIVTDWILRDVKRTPGRPIKLW